MAKKRSLAEAIFESLHEQDEAKRIRLISPPKKVKPVEEDPNHLQTLTRQDLLTLVEQKGAAETLRDHLGRTLAMVFHENGIRPDLFLWLLERRPDQVETDRDIYGDTVAHRIFRQGRWIYALYMVEGIKIPWHLPNDIGETPLTLLLKLGDPYQLFFAARFGKLEDFGSEARVNALQDEACQLARQRKTARTLDQLDLLRHLVHRRPLPMQLAYLEEEPKALHLFGIRFLAEYASADELVAFVKMHALNLHWKPQFKRWPLGFYLLDMRAELAGDLIEHKLLDFAKAEETGSNLLHFACQLLLKGLFLQLIVHQEASLAARDLDATGRTPLAYLVEAGEDELIDEWCLRGFEIPFPLLIEKVGAVNQEVGFSDYTSLWKKSRAQ